MEEEPLESVRSAARGSRSVDRIAGDGMPDRIEVDPDLVGPPGHEVELQQRPLGEPLANPVAGHGGAPVRDDRHPRPVLRVTPDRGLDPTDCGSHAALDQRLVGLLDPPRLELGHQGRLGGVAPGDHQQAARVAIEPVDDPRTLDAGDAAPGRTRRRGRAGR